MGILKLWKRGEEKTYLRLKNFVWSVLVSKTIKTVLSNLNIYGGLQMFGL